MDTLIIKTKNWTRGKERNANRHFDALGFLKRQNRKLYDQIIRTDFVDQVINANDELRGQARKDKLVELFKTKDVEVRFE